MAFIVEAILAQTSGRQGPQGQQGRAGIPSLLSLLSFPLLYGNRGQWPFIGVMQVKLQPSMPQG